MQLVALDLKTISKFAQLEYKLGDPERGKTIFEGIVDSHPKRWDLWSIYIDMEAARGDMQGIRYWNLFLNSITGITDDAPQKCFRPHPCPKNDKPQGQVSWLQFPSRIYPF
jgi:hypothetical protein